MMKNLDIIDVILIGTIAFIAMAITAKFVIEPSCDTTCQAENRLVIYDDCIDDGRPHDVCLAIVSECAGE
jgi:hypothetical protein